VQITRDLKKSDPLPPFPRGGLHWSTLVGKRVAERLLRESQRASGINLGSLHVGKTDWTAVPNTRDADLAVFLNLAWRPVDYRVGRAALSCQPTELGRNTRIVAIGGSFVGQVFDAFHECDLFKEVTEYFYYTQYRLDWPSRLWPVYRSALDWREILQQPTLLVLEINELYIARPTPHLDQFLDDAIKALK